MVAIGRISLYIAMRHKNVFQLMSTLYVFRDILREFEGNLFSTLMPSIWTAERTRSPPVSVISLSTLNAAAVDENRRRQAAKLFPGRRRQLGTSVRRPVAAPHQPVASPGFPAGTQCSRSGEVRTRPKLVTYFWCQQPNFRLSVPLPPWLCRTT